MAIVPYMAFSHIQTFVLGLWYKNNTSCIDAAFLNWLFIRRDYAIIKHCNAELAYALELPKQHCEAQKELGIEKEASYIITAQ